MAHSEAYARLIGWNNLHDAWCKAAVGKRGKVPAAAFEHRLSDNLRQLQRELEAQVYLPGAYQHFFVHEPKQRKISAAPFRDRVVHHALCNVIEPRFEKRFIPDSYANRKGKGTHRAIDRLQALSREYSFVLRLDVVRHFPSIDHALLERILAHSIPEADIMWLVGQILASGQGVLADQYEMVWFPGDGLLAIDRPRGLPIGNLTSQFWSNCYLDPLDHFVKRRLRCAAYLRYVDDLALFGNSKAQLWGWKSAIVDFLAGLRLTVHDRAAQVAPVAGGIPWLGFVVYPTHRRLKARKVVAFDRRIRSLWAAHCAGRISFAEFDACVQGWIEHVRHADTWGLRQHVLGKPMVGRPPRPEAETDITSP